MDCVNVKLNRFLYLNIKNRFEVNKARGLDLQPNNPSHGYWTIFFVLFFFIGKILLLNMFVGIIIENIIINKQIACIIIIIILELHLINSEN